MLRESARALPLLALAAAACVPPTVDEMGDDAADEVTLDPDALAALDADDGGLVTALGAEGSFTTAGLMLDLADPEAELTVAVRGRRDGEQTDWTELETVFREGALVVMRAHLDAPISAPQLRLPAEAAGLVTRLTWTATEAPEPEEVPEIDASSRPLLAGLRSLGVVSRGAWGARATRCRTRDGAKDRVAIHHTAGPSSGGASRVRQTQAYHMSTRGYCDVGYHFLVARDGTVYEGRPLELQGAHVRGHNAGNVGVSFMGCYHPSGCGFEPAARRTPSSAQLAAAARVVGYLADRYAIPISSSRVRGHRDHSGASTACPGDHLRARLGTLRDLANPPDRTAPSWPANARLRRVRASGGRLVVGFPRARDASGIRRYELSVNGSRRATASGGATQIAVDGLRPYDRVRVQLVAVDPEGNRSSALTARFDTGAFADIAGNVHAGSIAGIARLGLTRGCNPPRNDRYCPDAVLTRGQLAAFLVRTFDLPLGGPDAFDDDDGSAFETSINALARAGITQGCGRRRFCPRSAVTRGELAAFLRRALSLPRGPDAFGDDDGHLFEAAIDAIAAAGITRGCGRNRYCPDRGVSRDEMATFLLRAHALR